MSKAKPEPRALPKRFYILVAHEAQSEGYSITLDGKPVRTPARQMLRVETLALAKAVVEEWAGQVEVIDPDRMPLTRLATIAIDRIAADRTALLADIARYIETDLLFYRAPATDETAEDAIRRLSRELRVRQDAAFDPLLQWVRREFGAVFSITESLMPVAQDAQAIKKIAAEFAAANDAELAALAMLVPLLGSALMALALWRGRVQCKEALVSVRLDEDFQAEQWGADPHVAREWEAKARDIVACDFFLREAKSNSD